MFSLIIVTILGYIAARVGYLTADIRPKISNLIFNITLPCTVLASVGEVDPSTGGDAIAWSIVLGAAIFFVMLVAAAVAVAVLRVPVEQRGLYLFQGVLTNTGFIGFAVLDSVFGGASVFLGSIFIAISNVFLYSLGIAALTSGGASGAEAHRASLAETARTVLRNMLNVPLVVSLIAMVVFFANIPVPAPIMQAADMTGGITAPLAMMLVGLSIADADLKSVLADGACGASHSSASSSPRSSPILRLHPSCRASSPLAFSLCCSPCRPAPWPAPSRQPMGKTATSRRAAPSCRRSPRLPSCPSSCWS